MFDRFDPRTWPDWAWVVLTLLAGFIRFDYSIAGYSLATGVALAAGSFLGPARGVRTQSWAALVAVPLAALGLVGTPLDVGYAIGRIGVAWVAGRLSPAAGELSLPRAARLGLATMAVVAATVTWHWNDPTLGMHLKSYYSATLALGLAIAFAYALRLVARPRRVLGLLAALAPYYAAGVGGVAVLVAAGSVLLPAEPGALLFHGFVTHLPGDALTAVVVAALADPRSRWRRHG